MQSAPTGPSRGLSIVAGVLTSVQFLVVLAAFLGLLVLLVAYAPSGLSTAQSVWHSGGIAGFFAPLILLVAGLFALLAVAVTAGLGYLAALLGIATGSIVRGRGERLVLAGVVNVVVATVWLVAIVVSAAGTQGPSLEGMAVFGALFVVAVSAAACCFVARRAGSARSPTM